MNFPLAITDCRMLTPLDDRASDTWRAIRAGRRVESQVAVQEGFLAGETELDRSIRLALAVALPMQISPDTALFCGTSKGPVSTILAAADKNRRGELLTDHEARHIALGASAMAAILCERLRITALAHTSVAACSSGLHALHRAALAIRQGECARALVVAADASLHPLFQASFERLGVIAPANAEGVRRCEPFSAEGRGFFLIEAAAAILLEAEPSVAPLAWLEDSWIGGDSTGLIAIDPDGRTLAHGLRAVGGGDFAFVHAHATGTGHDAYELAAIRSVCGDAVPVFSHKKFLGHSLGAAGLLSVCLSVMCHQHGETPEGASVAPGAQSLTIAQGFGGHIGIARLRGASLTACM